MIDVILDGLLDTLKLCPYLIITFLILEYIEHKFTNKNLQLLSKKKRLGPLYGSFLGALPQCGFSAMASNLYAGGIITMGTVIAIFLSTSDEMLPILIGEQIKPLNIITIVGFKVLAGIIIGFLVDLIFNPKSKITKQDINQLCDNDECDCEKHGIFVSSLIHTSKTLLFVLIANLLINIIIYYIGEDSISNILINSGVIKYFISSLIGLIPNCAPSIIITKLYVSDIISVGTLLSGLLTGSGIGILLLFKENKNIKDNLFILTTIYLIGIILGIIVDIIL